MAITDPIEGLIAQCTCEYFQLLDFLLREFFDLFGATWSNCFCGGNPTGTSSGVGINSNAGLGVLRTISNLIQAILFVVTDLFRKFPLECYWRPFPEITAVEETWIFNFLGPIGITLYLSLWRVSCFFSLSLSFSGCKLHRCGKCHVLSQLDIWSGSSVPHPRAAVFGKWNTVAV